MSCTLCIILCTVAAHIINLFYDSLLTHLSIKDLQTSYDQTWIAISVISVEIFCILTSLISSVLFVSGI